MAILTAFISWFLIPYSNFINTIFSILSSIFVLSNFYYWNIFNNNYWAPESALEPFLHTWSLSIEWQFYLLFPLFLIFAVNRKLNLNKCLILIIIVNLIFNQFSGNLSTSPPFFDKNFNLFSESYLFSFYSPLSRIWEFCFGVLAANVKVKNYSFFMVNFYQAIGLLIIFVFSLCYSLGGDFHHPSVFTIFPVFGTFLVIIFINQKSFFNYFLSNTYLVYIGLISYSLYVWHIPILVFNEYLLENTYQILNLFIFILLISVISFHYYEKPLRNKKKIDNEIFIKIFSSLFIILIVTLIIITQYPKNKIENKKFLINGVNLDNRYLLDERNKFAEYHKSDYLNNGKKKLVIIGNSHGRDIYNSIMINKNLINFDVSFIHSNIKDMSNPQKYKKIIDSDVVLISTRWDNFDLKNLDSVLNALKNKLVLVSNQPLILKTKATFTLYDQFLLSKNNKFTEDNLKELKSKIYNIYIKNKSSNKINQNIEYIINKYSNVKLLDIKNIFCEKKKFECFLTDSNRNKLFYDGFHFTVFGFNFFGPMIMKEIDKLLY